MIIWFRIVLDGISIHALRGEGDASRMIFFASAITISIHALRGEGDQMQGKE